MIRRLIIAAAPVALAFASTPTLAQEVASDELTQDDADALASMMGGMFGEAEPLTQEQQGRLPIAQKVVSKLFPEGTYAKMMQDSMQPMMQGMLGDLAGKPAISLMKLTGLGMSDLAALDETQLEQAAALLDPAADERNAAMGEVTVAMITDVMNQIEPAYRAGLTRAYAVRFSEAELADLDGFFSTKTGGRYAGESFLIFADPQVMSAMNDMMPAMMEMMPTMMGQMAEVAERYPEGRRFSDLDAGEKNQLAELLGVSLQTLADSEPATVENILLTPEEGETSTE